MSKKPHKENPDRVFSDKESLESLEYRQCAAEHRYEGILDEQAERAREFRENRQAELQQLLGYDEEIEAELHEVEIAKMNEAKSNTRTSAEQLEKIDERLRDAGEELLTVSKAMDRSRGR